MKKILTSSWFWLMIIVCILFVRLFIDLAQSMSWDFWKCEIFWTAISSLGALIGVFVAVFTYRHSEIVRKKQATYDAYHQFKNDVFYLENFICQCDVNAILKQKQRKPHP